MSSDFVITERPDIGGFIVDEPARFVWTVAGHSIPFKPWTFGVEQRTIRIDYGGMDNPTEQVLGPRYSDFTVNGEWLNKWNPIGGPKLPTETEEAFIARANGQLPDADSSEPGIPGGFASRTRRDFEAMVRRGNLIQIDFQGIAFIGLITNVTFDYRHEGDIGYTFTFSPHRRPGNDELAATVVPTANLDPSTIAKGVKTRTTELVNTPKPSQYMTGTLSLEADEFLTKLDGQADELQTAVDQRILSVVETSVDDTLPLKKAVEITNSLKVTGRSTARLVKNVSHTANLAFQEPIAALQFELWARTTGSGARQAVYDSWRAQVQLEQQAEPDALALYRPYRGQTLYQVSQQFYGTPFNAEQIRKRNGLTKTIMTSEELLIIPKSRIT